MKGKRVAAIDVGSNSVRLMVAEFGAFLTPVFADRRVTRLYQGLRDGLLDERAVERTADAVCEFIRLAGEHGAERIEAFGTSALREGSNFGPILERAARADVNLRVLSGEEEARVAYAGAAPSGRAGLLDIGGGSTEWVAGEDGHVLAAASAPVGAVRLSEAASARKTLRAPVDAAIEAMKPAYEAVAPFPPDQWIGVGGSITTLASMLRQLTEYSDEAVRGVEITHTQAKSFYDLIVFMPSPLRAQLKGLESARADIIHFGIAILLAFFELTGAPEIRVGVADNLLGYIGTYLQGDSI